MGIKEKLKKLWKSWTVWFSMILMTLPDTLPFALEKLPEIKAYLPQALYDPAMRYLALIVFALRIKTFMQAMKPPNQSGT